MAESDETTLAVYPFPFHLEIIFSLEESALKVEWQVTNTGKAALLYSIGGHPALPARLTMKGLLEIRTEIPVRSDCMAQRIRKV